VLAPPLKGQKIFIASMARNSEYMLRMYWNSALIRLVEALGPENVYVSIMESGSAEDTKGALRELEDRLNNHGVRNKIILGIDHVQHEQMLQNLPEEGEDRTGWIFTGRSSGKKGWEYRRIPYLAALRNRVMEPMMQEAKNMKFDKVLWINDVVFTVSSLTCCKSRAYSVSSPPFDSTSLAQIADVFLIQTEDVMTLFSTQGGDYAAACALDFSHNPEA